MVMEESRVTWRRKSQASPNLKKSTLNINWPTVQLQYSDTPDERRLYGKTFYGTEHKEKRADRGIKMDSMGITLSKLYHRQAEGQESLVSCSYGLESDLLTNNWTATTFTNIQHLV